MGGRWKPEVLGHKEACEDGYILRDPDYAPVDLVKRYKGANQNLKRGFTKVLSKLLS